MQPLKNAKRICVNFFLILNYNFILSCILIASEYKKKRIICDVLVAMLLIEGKSYAVIAINVVSLSCHLFLSEYLRLRYSDADVKRC